MTDEIVLRSMPAIFVVTLAPLMLDLAR